MPGVVIPPNGSMPIAPTAPNAVANPGVPLPGVVIPPNGSTSVNYATPVPTPSPATANTPAAATAIAYAQSNGQGTLTVSPINGTITNRFGEIMVYDSSGNLAPAPMSTAAVPTPGGAPAPLTTSAAPAPGGTPIPGVAQAAATAAAGVPLPNAPIFTGNTPAPTPIAPASGTAPGAAAAIAAAVSKGQGPLSVAPNGNITNQFGEIMVYDSSGNLAPAPKPVAAIPVATPTGTLLNSPGNPISAPVATPAPGTPGNAPIATPMPAPAPGVNGAGLDATTFNNLAKATNTTVLFNQLANMNLSQVSAQISPAQLNQIMSTFGADPSFQAFLSTGKIPTAPVPAPGGTPIPGVAQAAATAAAGVPLPNASVPTPGNALAGVPPTNTITNSPASPVVSAPANNSPLSGTPVASAAVNPTVNSANSSIPPAAPVVNGKGLDVSIFNNFANAPSASAFLNQLAAQTITSVASQISQPQLNQLISKFGTDPNFQTLLSTGTIPVSVLTANKALLASSTTQVDLISPAPLPLNLVGIDHHIS